DATADRILYVGISVPLGPGRQASTSWQRSRGRDQLVADLVQPVPGDGGLGWRLQGRGGDGVDGGLAELEWQGQSLRLGGGAARNGANTHVYASAGGSLVLMGGAVFASRRIDD